MGIVFRQSIKYTIVSYLGVAIGTLSALFIYPQEEELYGLFQLFTQGAMFIMSIFLAGFSAHAIRFFPDFKDSDNKHNGFLAFLLLGAVAGFVLFLLFLPLLQHLILEVMFAGNPSIGVFSDYFLYIIPLVLFYMMNAILLRYISNFGRIVVPNLLNDLFIKISLPLFILAFSFSYISTEDFIQLIVAMQLLILIGMLLYLKRLGQFSLKLNLKFIKPDLRKKIVEYSLFGLFSELGNRLVVTIDVIMVSALISVELGGAYAIIRVISEVIGKPILAIQSIVSPMISQYWNENNTDEIAKVYRKSSDTLLLASTLLFFMIWNNIDDLFSIMPDSNSATLGKYVFLFLGISKIVDAATSVNSHIIGYSKYFRFNFYSLLILAGFNVVFNLVFIEQYHVIGAAIATFVSLFLFNLLKFGFIWRRFGFQPFNKNTLIILAIALSAYASTAFLPLDFHPIVNIVIRSVIMASIFLIASYRLKVSEEMNIFLDKYVMKYFRKG